MVTPFEMLFFKIFCWAAIVFAILLFIGIGKAIDDSGLGGPGY